MKNRIKKIYLVVIVIFIIIISAISIYINTNINKNNNIVRLINNNWEISLPNCKSFEILKRDFEEFLFEGEVMINITYDDNEIDKLLNNFEWITDKKVIKENIQKCNKILEISDTCLNKIDLSNENNNFFFKNRKTKY